MATYLTKKGREKIYQEYLNIDDEIKKTNREMGESAKLDNDLRENPEFMALRVKAMYELPQKKEELFKVFSQAEVIEEMPEYINFDGSTVIMGTKVVLDFDGDEEVYTIHGTNEGNIEDGIISENSPIARAIIGKKVGDIVTFRNMSIKILSVELS